MAVRVPPSYPEGVAGTGRGPHRYCQQPRPTCQGTQTRHRKQSPHQEPRSRVELQVPAEEAENRQPSGKACTTAATTQPNAGAGPAIGTHSARNSE